VYDLNINQNEIWKQIRRLTADLDEWEDHLPIYLRRNSDDSPRVSGSSSLQLGYLAVRLLLNRISLHVSIHLLSSTKIRPTQNKHKS
jgi:hypothetical protein